ncbi:MAG TPA: PEP-CTERM sorting domain-containing protein [Fimbriimonadaceae bacterium]|nr:PEP-CTERM sorting domain-containing protein [Fimbriimonadaceae bacterium]
MKSITLRALASIGVAAAIAAPALASSAAIQMTAVTSWHLWSGKLGWRFVPNQDIWLTDLGNFDLEMDGFASSVEVGVFEWDTDVLVAYADLSAGTVETLDGFFRYKAVTPVQLITGRDYIIWGHNGIDAHTTNLHATETYAPEITVLANGARYNGWGGVSDGGNSLGSYTTYTGPNFKFSTVPEPATLGTLALGAIALVRRRSRRR